MIIRKVVVLGDHVTVYLNDGVIWSNKLDNNVPMIVIGLADNVILGMVHAFKSITGMVPVVLEEGDVLDYLPPYRTIQ